GERRWPVTHWKLSMNPAKSEYLYLAAISAISLPGASSISVSGSTEPSRWRCSSAFGRECKIGIRLIMTAAETEAIAGGYHGDPFAVLGPHLIQKSRGA